MSTEGRRRVPPNVVRLRKEVGMLPAFCSMDAPEVLVSGRRVNDAVEAARHAYVVKFIVQACASASVELPWLQQQLEQIPYVRIPRELQRFTGLPAEEFGKDAIAVVAARTLATVTLEAARIAAAERPRVAWSEWNLHVAACARVASKSLIPDTVPLGWVD